MFYYGKSNGSDKPERIKMKTPSYQNILSYKPILKDQQLADLPLLVASTDPCFSCCDRVTVLDTNTEKKTMMTANDLRRMKR